RCSCGMNALAGSRPTSTRISRRRVATYSRTIQYDTTPAPSCSSSSRSKIRFAVCRCFRGASRSERSQSSITTRYASSREPRLGGCFLSFGHADSSAAVTVRKPTPCLRCSARLDIPDRASRRIAAYRSTRERGCVIGGTPDVSTPWARLSAPGHRLGTVTAWDPSPEGLALPRGRGESHACPGRYDGPALRGDEDVGDEHAQDQACDAADDINLDTTCPPRVPGATKICLRGAQSVFPQHLAGPSVFGAEEP